MIFWIEALAACLIFTAFVVPYLLKKPLDWVSDYPPEIQRRARELGLIPKEQKKLPVSVILRKAVGSLLLAGILSAVLVYVNGAETFWQGFGLGYGLWAVVAWYDALVIDCLFFCHSKKVILPGTEDLTESYHDYWFHIKMSLIGMVLGLPAALLTGLGVVLLA